MLLSTEDVARELGIGRRMVQHLIREKRLPATKMGRDYFVEKSDLRYVRSRPKTGRPRKK